MNKPKKMIRKIIYMPPELVEKIDITAKDLKVSFSEIVNRLGSVITVIRQIAPTIKSK